MNRMLGHLLGKVLGSFTSYRRLVEMSSKLNLPLVTPLKSSVQITLHCNSKCSYCDMWKLGESPNSCYAVASETLDDVFCSLSELGVRFVSLTGGEPLTHKDLNEIIHSARHHKLLTDISTNGISLTKDRVLELADAGIQGISLSLDTLDPKIYEKHRGVPFKFAQRALESLSYVVSEYPTIGGTVNCVITRYNIGKLVRFAESIAEYGKSAISVTLQPYHRPPSFSEISGELDQEMTRKLCLCYRDRLPEGLTPNNKLKPKVEKEIEELIQLKRRGFPLRNSETYLKMIPDFLFNNQLPRDFTCLAGYTCVFIRYDLKVLPCYRLPPVGEVLDGDLADIWFSKRYRKQRKRMKDLICHGCMFLCYTEPGWSSSLMTWKFYDCIYRSSIIPRDY